MKRKYSDILIVAVLYQAFLITMLLPGCGGGFNPSDAQVSTAVQIGTSVAFQYAIKDDSKRALIANYVSAIAGVARAATGTQTPDDLGKALAAAVPTAVQEQIPEITSMVIPLVVSTYQAARDHYGSDYAKLYARMNAVATGLEKAVAPYISKP